MREDDRSPVQPTETGLYAPSKASWYDRWILPGILDLFMKNRALARERGKQVPRATGRVLEIGSGSGLNLPHYQAAHVQELIALEPSQRLRKMAEKRCVSCGFEMTPLAAGAENIPLESGCIDTAVTTWSLCTIPEPLKALSEVRRVLRPDGALLFVEHGQSPDADVRRWQDRLTPIWKRIGGGCHLNRPIASLLEEAGFRIEELENSYLPGPRPLTYHYRGIARPTPMTARR
jgi:ubiquinone/menaquinone biosynthesis C-methylase UbiE